MTVQDLTKIFDNNLQAETLERDAGIYEFYSETINHKELSIGVSYETIGEYTGYIFNLFADGEYINIPCCFHSIYDAIEAVADEWDRMEQILENRNGGKIHVCRNQE